MSNDNYNSEIYELLSAYLDDELSESQLERVGQLLRDDPQAQEIFANLQWSSQAVSSLPRESVPRDLTEEVLYALERDTLLDGNDDMAIVAGERHLRFRNFLGIAAIMLLVGAVFVVVYNVLVPPEVTQEKQVIATQGRGQEVENQFPDEGIGPKSQEVTTFRSLKEATRTLVANDPSLEPTPPAELFSTNQPEPRLTKTFSEDIEAVVSEPLPNLPAIEPFEVPRPGWSSLRLKSQIVAGDTVTIERLSNLLAGLEVEYLVSGNSAGLKNYAFVCEREQFAELYRALREALPAKIDLELDGVPGYKKLSVSSVTAEEIIPLASLGEKAEQLTYLRENISQDRIIYTSNTIEIAQPIWRQMASIVPERYRDRMSRTLKDKFESDDIVPEDESIIQRYQRFEEERATDNSSSSPTALVKNSTVTDLTGQLSATRQQQSVARSGGLVANVIETEDYALIRTIESPTSTTVGNWLVENQRPEGQQASVKVDYIAVEIVLWVEQQVPPQDQSQQSESFLDMLPFSPETWINFGYSPR